MSTDSVRTARQAFTQCEALVPAQLEAMEAVRSIWEMIGEEHKESFVVVGGAALLFYGSGIPTYNADIAITGSPLPKCEERAKNDGRFTQGVMGDWEFQASYGFSVKIDFLDKLGFGGYLNEHKQYCIIDRVPVATLVDLALGKGGSWFDQERTKDLQALEWVVGLMVDQGLDLAEVGMDEILILRDVITRLSSTTMGRRLADIIRGLL
ncbi:hypothetical protein HOY80DRAFT_1098112 [Tuber brumale]|nr:hypothetical protein HOY80DRAFT_1098112 [Tuber brumale]